MQIKRFLELSSEFVNTRIDEGSDDSENFLNVDGNEEGIPETEKLKISLGGKDIVQLKSSHILRGLIPLEKLFDQNDVGKDPKVKLDDNAVEKKNIATEETPRVIKLSKKFSAKEK